MSIKIAFIIGSIDDGGGVETVLEQLSQSFISMGKSVVIINLFGSYVNNNFSQNGCTVVNLFKSKISYLFFPLYVYKLRKLIRLLDVDCVIDMGTHFSLFSNPATFATKIKTISCEHVNLYASKKNFLVKFIFCRFSDTIVTLTERDKLAYINAGINNKVICIPNYTRYANKKLSSFTSNQNSKVLVAVGRLGAQKSFDRLINIWSKVELKKDFKLEIWGDGEDRDYLLNLIHECNVSDSCQLRGRTDTISEVYGNAYLLLMTSIYEGYPMVLIESISHGVPVISYDCPTGPSEIIENEITGFLIENGNEESFVQKLNLLLGDETFRRRMSEACVGKRYIYSEEYNMILWEELFRSFNYANKN